MLGCCPSLYRGVISVINHHVNHLYSGFNDMMMHKGWFWRLILTFLENYICHFDIFNWLIMLYCWVTNEIVNQLYNNKMTKKSVGKSCEQIYRHKIAAKLCYKLMLNCATSWCYLKLKYFNGKMCLLIR